MSLITQLHGRKGNLLRYGNNGIDANNAELVGLSFSWKPGEAYYVPVPAEQRRSA